MARLNRTLLEALVANLEKLEIDEIKRQLQPFIKGMVVESPVVDPGTFLYRARKIGNAFNKTSGIKYTDLIYPPPHLAPQGRLNRPGKSVMYCSVSKESGFYELQDLRTGDELVLTFWQTTEKMFLNNIGYTQHVFERLGAKRQCPQWRSVGPSNANKAIVSLPQIAPQDVDSVLSNDENGELRRALSEHFMCSVGAGEMHKYKLTTAIGELHLGAIVNLNCQFAGVLYPSARMWANGDNLALLPWFVDQHIKFKKASHIRIDNQKDTQFSITTLDSASTFDDDGKLIWLGRMPAWKIQPGQSAKCAVETGRDSNGDYETSQDGTPCHWAVTDAATGLAIEAQ